MVSMMVPLFFWYASGSGAPSSVSSSPVSLELCRRAVSFAVSADARPPASTITENVCSMLPIPWSWEKDPPPFKSRSRMAMDRSIMSMVSRRSFSILTKSPSSFSRISLAALRSDSSIEMAVESSSTFVPRDSISSEAFSMIASKSFFWATKVLIDVRISRDRSSQNSENSSYVLLAPSPSLMILAWRSDSSCTTFCTGFTAVFTAVAEACKGASRRARTQQPRAAFIALCVQDAVWAQAAAGAEEP
mmetsp:Transcript_49850/g.154168  ORF Transcript_49850/g.154168 Transcript_49850/m.154168 type:complete len:247 (+) Transcript_49850:1536-2276(+)